MQYGLLTYDFTDHFNIGDYIQSLAARQFLPRVDRYLCRENLNEFSGPLTKVICNGWFLRHTRRWPPSKQIDPLFISFHMNTKKPDGFFLNGGVEYFKAHEPIGCRDLPTQQLLEERGIKAYFSACLTLTLGRSFQHQADEDVYLVDILSRFPTGKSVFKSLNSVYKAVKTGDIFLLGKRDRIISRMLGDDIIRTGKEITHVYPSKAYPTEDSRFELAVQTLRRYERAKLVVTSRIHCALPCLAMGTPVIFVNGGLRFGPDSRFGGIVDLFHTINVSRDGKIETNFDLEAVQKTGRLEPKTRHLQYLETLVSNCERFINC